MKKYIVVVAMLLVMCSVAFAEGELAVVAKDGSGNSYAVFTDESEKVVEGYCGIYAMIVHDETILNDFRAEANNNSAVGVVYFVTFTPDLKKHQILLYQIVDETLNVLHEVKFGYNKSKYRNTIKDSCMEAIGKKIKASAK